MGSHVTPPVLAKLPLFLGKLRTLNSSALDSGQWLNVALKLRCNREKREEGTFVPDPEKTMTISQSLFFLVTHTRSRTHRTQELL